jgi:hypothetical protein
MASTVTVQEHEDPKTLGVRPEAEAEHPPAWEQVAAGRYMPRRIRGSFRGRELG